MKKSLKYKKIGFIADFFRSEVLGGAEANNDVLIKHLENEGYSIERIKSSSAKLNEDTFYIVANFVGLSEFNKNFLKEKCSYIISEHDHKYLKTRDPSCFKDFKAPHEQLVNQDFYRNAKAVIVLSEICKEVICKNLKIKNVYNIGCSLWSEERLEFLRTLVNKEKNIEVAILKSTNPTKGTSSAVEYCSKRKIEFEYIWSPNEKTFLHQLAGSKKLVYIPQVLETFCRLTAEAKMLKCKLITKPKLLGFASEECFALEGEELIDDIEKRVKNALNLFNKLIEEEEKVGDGKITAILTCYRRPHLLDEQIQALKEQTSPPDEIMIWVNDSPENQKIDFKKYDGIKIFECNHNWKFYGRFSAALLADTEFIAIFDDDTIPAKQWLSNCLETMNTKEGILGGVGCILPSNGYYGHDRIGWSNPNKEVTEVDLVGHAWFFKREWLQYLWREKPQTWDNGEDIQFSYLAQKYGNIKTYVPPHDQPEKFSSTKGMKYGIDDVATSSQRNHKSFYKERNDCVNNAKKNGWKIIRER